MPGHDERVSWRGRSSVALFGLTLLLATSCRKASAEDSQAPEGERAHTPSAEQAFAGASGTPTPAMLCDHVLGMMMRETGTQMSPDMPELQELRVDCVREGEQNRAMVGEDIYAEQARCVLAAESYDDLALCAGDGAAEAPPPRVVCDHVIDLMLLELGDEASAMPRAEIEDLRRECVTSASEERRDNPEDYAFEAHCVLSARRLDDLDRCEDVGSGPGPGNGPVGSDRDRQMCMHIVTLLDRETAGTGASLSADQIEEFVETCVFDFQAERRALGDAAAEALIDCVLMAANPEQLMACEGG